MSHLLELCNNAINLNDIQYVANYLNISISTIQRWIDLKRVPIQYEFELRKLNNENIDYSIYDYKQKDQFFTPRDTAKYCVNQFKNIVPLQDEHLYTYIEPSAGSGNFLPFLPQSRTISFDIEPLNSNIQRQDFLTWKPDINQSQKFIVFGNPPFGLRGHLALKFINHSNDFADYVCFILPQLFESDGKGVPRKRVYNYNLIHSEKLDTQFHDPKGNNVKVNCVFQIWSKKDTCDEYNLQNDNIDTNITVYSLSDGGTSSNTRNKNMIDKCDIYLPSTCYGKENMCYKSTFIDLPGKKGYGIVFKENKEECIELFKSIDWSDVAFLSTNSAYNIRSSQIVKAFSTNPLETKYKVNNLREFS